MKFSFNAKIYKVGINPCGKVPKDITNQMVASKGYIPVKGKIEQHSFRQTMVPVKDGPYRLFVNGPMLKGANVQVGDKVDFTIEQDTNPNSRKVSMPASFKERLIENKVLEAFKLLTPSRQQEILRYLSFLKTEESRERNIQKVIAHLKGEKKPDGIYRSFFK
jgi:hypothetical protein